MRALFRHDEFIDAKAFAARQFLQALIGFDANGLGGTTLAKAALAAAFAKSAGTATIIAAATGTAAAWPPTGRTGRAAGLAVT
jgi:hypothetical protein